jgi:hypothetical protein
LRSYSKKPPERTHTFKEILELAAELIDFHRLPDGTEVRFDAAGGEGAVRC